MTYTELKRLLRDYDLMIYANASGDEEIIERFIQKGMYAQDRLRRFGVDFQDTKGN